MYFLPLPYHFPWKTTETGNLHKVHHILRYVNIFSQNDKVTAWSPTNLQDSLLSFCCSISSFAFIKQLLNGCINIHSLTNGKRFPSGISSSDSLLKYTKSSLHFSLSFAPAWTNSLALCHSLKNQEIQTTISQGKKVQELRTFCRRHLQFSKTSLFKLN